MKLQKKNPFRMSYLSVAVICCLALSIVFFGIMYTSSREVQEQNNRKKAELILADLETQLQQFEEVALQLVINNRYQPFYFEEDKYREQLLLEDFEQYQHYSVLIDECFLYYGGVKLYHSSGHTINLQPYLSKMPQADQEKIEKELVNTREALIGTAGKAAAVPVSSGIYFMIPFRVSAVTGPTNAVLCVVVGSDDLEERFQIVSGGIQGNISLYRGNLLLYSSKQEACAAGQKKVLDTNTSDGVYTLCYLPDKESYVQNGLIPLLLLLVPTDLILVFLLAGMYAEKSYKPIREMSEKYRSQTMMPEVSQGENALEEIGYMMDSLLKGNEKAWIQIEQNKRILRKQVLQMMLEGSFSSDMLSHLDKLQIRLPGPYFYVISISFIRENGVTDEFLSRLSEELEGISSEEDNEYIYAVCDFQKKQLYILCSTMYEDSKEDLTEYICDVARSFAYEPVTGSGNVYQTLSRVAASWLESMDIIHNKMNQPSNEEKQAFVYDSKDLHRISAALASGNEAEALKGLESYVAQMQNGGMSLLMQQYIIMDFVSEITRQARKCQLELTKQSISLIISAKNLKDFETAAQDLIHEFFEKLMLSREQTEKEDTRRVYEYVKEHFAEYDMSIQKTAADLSISTAAVREAVYKCTGRMYKDYLMSLRIEYAKRLLADEELTVAEVCQKVGYSNVSYFIKMFKESTGVTPANFKAGD